MPLPAACSDVELVALLVGPKTAAKLYQGSLLKLLYHDAHPRLAAAMELVRRSLHETLQQKPALNSPSTVRDYTLSKDGVSLATKRQPGGNQPAPQVKLSEDKINIATLDPEIEKIKAEIRMWRKTRASA